MLETINSILVFYDGNKHFDSGVWWETIRFGFMMETNMKQNAVGHHVEALNQVTEAMNHNSAEGMNHHVEAVDHHVEQRTLTSSHESPFCRRHESSRRSYGWITTWNKEATHQYYSRKPIMRNGRRPPRGTAAGIPLSQWPWPQIATGKWHCGVRAPLSQTP